MANELYREIHEPHDLTVSELIAMLQNCPQDHTITFSVDVTTESPYGPDIREYETPYAFILSAVGEQTEICLSFTD